MSLLQPGNGILKTVVYNTFYSILQMLPLQSDLVSSNLEENNLRVTLLKKKDRSQQLESTLLLQRSMHILESIRKNIMVQLCGNHLKPLYSLKGTFSKVLSSFAHKT